MILLIASLIEHILLLNTLSFLMFHVTYIIAKKQLSQLVAFFFSIFCPIQASKQLFVLPGHIHLIPHLSRAVHHSFRAKSQSKNRWYTSSSFPTVESAFHLLNDWSQGFNPLRICTKLDSKVFDRKRNSLALQQSTYLICLLIIAIQPNYRRFFKVDLQSRSDLKAFQHYFTADNDLRETCSTLSDIDPQIYQSIMHELTPYQSYCSFAPVPCVLSPN
ncbi:hypothetical protein PIB30_044377 [Stylosanthes scabra]|uniref:Uncharacterized protein n=1 Tax=Stylosanthes scabra TaxID=79078 RepID=A0ABU6VGV0_9FABA|nr:hypothetical protein [Stylosanthes scabra]